MTDDGKRSPSRSLIAVFLVVTQLALAGCAPPVGVSKTDPASLLREQLTTRLVSGDLSAQTQAALRALDLEPNDPGSVDALIAEADADPAGPWRTAAAELLLDTAERTRPPDLSLYLDTARQADRQLAHAIGDDGALLGSDTEFAADLAHRALSRIIQLAGADLLGNADAIRITGVRGTSVLRIDRADPADRSRFDPARFDTLIPTDTIKITGMAARYRVDAFGSPVVAIREQTDADPPRTDPYIPPEGLHLPATATLRFDTPTDAALELWNTDHAHTVPRHGGTLRLSEDVTAPIASLFARTSLAEEAKRGMFAVEAQLDRLGIYLHEPYDPAKTPLLMVHGLRSSPITWRDMVNGLRADPELRARYQIWKFLYPTGLPVFRSAAYLREELERAADHFDPERDDPWRSRQDGAPGDMVIVGHSMGGLLTKMQVQQSGDRFWQSLTPEPFDTFEAPDEVRDHFRSVFFFEPNPDVSRVVFVATPHGGSDIADSAIGRLVDALVRPPGELAQIDEWIDDRVRRGSDDESTDPAAAADEHQIASGVPSSIDDLRPGSPHLRAIRETPVAPGVTAHVIYGTSAGDGDGVVPSASATSVEATSLFAVDAGHDAHTHPLAIRELRRILRRHAGLDMPGADDAPSDP